MTIAATTVLFLLLVGILVTIHEGGHFAAAKLLGVKVETFSIGMGPRILGFTKAGTDYRISAVPLGGYVRLKGEDPRDGQATPDPDSLQAAASWRRLLIYAAGPAANLLFPLLLYFGAGLFESRVPPAEVGDVLPDTPAQRAGLQPGDRIVQVGDTPVYSYGHMVAVIQGLPQRPTPFVVQRNGRTTTVRITPARQTVPKYPGMVWLAGHTHTVARIGITGVYPPSVIGVRSGSAAQAAGLRTFDRIVAVNGNRVATWKALEDAVRRHRGRTVVLGVQHLDANLLAAAQRRHSRRATVYPSTVYKVRLLVPPTATLEQLGMRPVLGHVVTVHPDSPAYRAGLRPGDFIAGIDGRPLPVIATLERLAAAATKGRISLLVERDGARRTVSWDLPKPADDVRADLGITAPSADLGFRLSVPTGDWKEVVPPPVPNDHRLALAAFTAWKQTAFWSALIADVIGDLFTGRLSPKMLSGPIGIAHATATVSQEGPGALVGFLGFLSINLGLLNLLIPIPVLDGGRLLIVFSEMVMRQRLSPTAQERILTVGAVMTLFLIAWVVIWDVARLVLAP